MMRNFNPWTAIGWILLVLLVVALLAVIAGLIQPALFGFEPRQ